MEKKPQPGNHRQVTQKKIMYDAPERLQQESVSADWATQQEPSESGQKTDRTL